MKQEPFVRQTKYVTRFGRHSVYRRIFKSFHDTVTEVAIIILVICWEFELQNDVIHKSSEL